MKAFKLNYEIDSYPANCTIFIDEINTIPKAKEWGVYLTDRVLNLLKSEDADIPSAKCVGAVTSYAVECGFLSEKKSMLLPMPNSIKISEATEHSS